MSRRFIITFPSVNSDIFDIEMMDLEGIPLFFHSVKNLHELYPNYHILVEGKNQKIIDYCKYKEIDIISNEHIIISDEIVNAYQPFYYRKSKYYIVDQYRSLKVTDLQSYLFALYIINRLKHYSLSEQQKIEKSDAILAKGYCNEQICLIGDSLIEFWDIQEINGLQVFNAGVGDLTTSECLELIVDKLQLCAFQTFFIIIGTNDLKYRIDETTIVANVLRLINTINRSNEKAIIIYSLVPNVYRRWDRQNDEIKKLNVALRNAIGDSALILDSSFLNNQYGELHCNYTIDGLHFNKEAYNKLTEYLEKII